MIRISLIIPTQRRPEGLRIAARSLFRQVGVNQADLELVVVDNDQVPSAQATVNELSAETAIPLVYVHEPAPGVANARNAAMGVARGDFIAFLDDDEEAPETWLAAMISAQARLGADVVFGPVRGRAPPEIQAHRAYLEWFFSRTGPDSETLLEDYYGCGCSFLKRSALPDPRAPFSAIRNHIGGEDDLLFGQMRLSGARFGWSPEAWVWEDPVPSRLTLNYTLRRAFAYGQGPASAAAAKSPPDRVAIAGWMVKGLFQAAGFGLLAGLKWLTRAPDLAMTLDRAARGLGKTFWWQPFKIHFYGLREDA